MNKFQLSEKSKQQRDGVDQRLIEISDLAIKITLVDFGHPQYSGRRSAEEQNVLYCGGKSQCDGYVNISNHQIGNALDFYAYVNGKASWEPAHLSIVAAAFLQAASMLGYKVSWGGLFERKKEKLIDGVNYGWDMPHIELID